MHLDWWTLGLQTVNVVVLLWILKRFLFRPVAKIVADRQAAADVELRRARQARAEAEKARDAARTATSDIAAQRAGLLVRAEEEAEAEKAKLLEAAEAEAEAAREAARAELDRMRAAETQALTDAAGTLAVDIAERLFARLPEEARINGFMGGLVKAVSALPDAARAEIASAGPVRLRAARALTADETDRLEASLSEVLAHPVEVAVESDETLIAGLELDAPQAVVRNHFRADLDLIRQELTRHD
ncbi:hypothetical protein [Roseibium aggregatum]|uniref:ATP synthase subunit b n=1 Tax=Roseibium aggregatum TaxID=187304 RepID=A0A939EFT0_9HYPH|nr:hypothetical protein [Roseibium aggregatum]MBN9671378.1 hypothetical protein [Roseibium aggregatum]